MFLDKFIMRITKLDLICNVSNYSFTNIFIYLFFKTYIRKTDSSHLNEDKHAYFLLLRLQ